MRILIGTDGSLHSQRAIEECCRCFADSKGLEIRIASTYEEVIPLNAFDVMVQDIEKDNLAAKQKAEQIVVQAEEFIKKKLPDAKIETVVAMGFAERFIVENAKTWAADLIIVGSHGRGFLGRFTLGSVSSSIIHNASCSVIVVRQKDEL